MEIDLEELLSKQSYGVLTEEEKQILQDLDYGELSAEELGIRFCSDCGAVIKEGYVYEGGAEYRCEDCHQAHIKNETNEWILKCFGLLPVTDEEQEEIDSQDEWYWTQWSE